MQYVSVNFFEATMNSSKVEWRDWLYDDELARVEAIDAEVTRLRKQEEPLLWERRGICQRAYQRALRESRRVGKAQAVAEYGRENI
jgi:hypothetical protein